MILLFQLPPFPTVASPPAAFPTVPFADTGTPNFFLTLPVAALGSFPDVAHLRLPARCHRRRRRWCRRCRPPTDPRPRRWKTHGVEQGLQDRQWQQICGYWGQRIGDQSAGAEVVVRQHQGRTDMAVIPRRWAGEKRDRLGGWCEEAWPLLRSRREEVRQR